MRFFPGLLAIPLFALVPCVFGQGYQKPPAPVLDALTAPAPPMISVSPARDFAIVMQPVRYPSIGEVAQLMARLAGLRIDVKSNGLHLAPYYTSYELRNLATGATVPLTTPPAAKLGPPIWSPDGDAWVFTITTDTAIQLWMATTKGGSAHRLSDFAINGVSMEAEDAPVRWLPDNRTLLVRLVPADRGPSPAMPALPPGPDVQESSGHAGPVRTYEDLLSSVYDEQLFTYYFTSQPALFDTERGTMQPLGPAGTYTDLTAAPDGQHFLVERIHQPYSYLLPASDFPLAVEVWDRTAKRKASIADLPLADRVPIGGVRTGPRDYQWLPDGKSATLVWAEALDGGNPKEKVPHRDRIVTLSAPFSGEPTQVFQTEKRFMGLEPLEGTPAALITDYDRDTRWLRTMSVDLSKSSDTGSIVFERNAQDRYKDPGTPVMRMQPDGKVAIGRSGDSILLAGLGASPQGDMPFLHRFNLKSKATEPLFQSRAGQYEAVEAVLNDTGTRLLTRRESPSEPPNYFLRSGATVQQLTHYTNPNPDLLKIKKQLVTYQREDGVPLSFILYLPPNYQPGTKLPTLLWAYPLEYNDSATAGQVSGSTDRFPVLAGHQLFVLHGYAILENAGMPVIGDPETVNNSYVKQIVMDAKAAIDKALELGVTDRNRVGVGGHSYGAFMTANLLAHSDMFAAGIAESGAYNRTLTPFGFQTERRTIWEAPDIYLTMSPFLSAQKIKTPLLLIHGEADDNTGTFPIQSERMYAAIKGNGGVTRLVMLPAEAHGYRALETHEHVLYEELRWMDKYLKDGSADGTAASR